MSRQTVQQQTPIYHVCPECQGYGCRDCGSMGIVEGDFPSELLDLAISSPDIPEPDLECPYCGELGSHADDCLYINAATAYNHVCVHCGKSDWDSSVGCLNPVQYTPTVGDWVCGNYLGFSK